jgi:aerobic-type carbon monoxide dehydrogenase small subunit (CoxS/CutS family)
LKVIGERKQKKHRRIILEHRIKLKINGRKIEKTVGSSTTLLDFLRNHCHLTGVKEGCGVGECGTCTIIMNGQSVRSCLILAVEADGSEIITIEGIAQGEKLSPVQEAFVEHGAVQCGFCIPGFVIAGENLLRNNPNPGRKEILDAFGGHLCRCTGYAQIIEAMEAARDKIKNSQK